MTHTSQSPVVTTAHKLGLIAVAGGALFSSACVVTSSDGGNVGGAGGAGGVATNPVGPVASNASEAFPDKPASAPVLTAKDIIKACATEVACDMSGPKHTPHDRMAGVLACVEYVTWSAERAIPMSGLVHDNERAEYYVSCLDQHAGDCSSVAACRSGRASDIYCEEDGCRGPEGASVSCQGTVATIDGASRDCALAYATCDPSSPTGCTDRHFTSCPAGSPHVDRCDGNVRLGCDSSGQVSYRDCSRMGGRCGTLPDGHQGCIYTEGSADAGCADGSRLPACSGVKLSACVNGRLVSADAAALCAG